MSRAVDDLRACFESANVVSLELMSAAVRNKRETVELLIERFGDGCGWAVLLIFELLVELRESVAAQGMELRGVQAWFDKLRESVEEYEGKVRRMETRRRGRYARGGKRADAGVSLGGEGLE